MIKVKKMLLSLPAVPGMGFESCNLLISLSEQEPDSDSHQSSRWSWMHSHGEETGDKDIARLSPLMHGNINMPELVVLFSIVP